jgi:hypothetical protein
MSATVAWAELSIPPEKQAALVAWVEFTTASGSETETSDLYNDSWGGTAPATKASVAWVDLEMPPQGVPGAPSVAINTIHGSNATDDIALFAGYNDTNKTLTITGVASDDVSVARVDISVDGAANQIATGTTSWSFVINTAAWAAGPHTIRAIAVDGSGINSTPVTATVWYAPGRMYGAATAPGEHLVPISKYPAGQVP